MSLLAFLCLSSQKIRIMFHLYVTELLNSNVALMILYLEKDTLVKKKNGLNFNDCIPKEFFGKGRT